MEQAERGAGVDYCFELPARRRVLCRIGYLNGQSCRPVVHALISWIVFVGESHAALYGKWQPGLGGLEDDRILIASVVEPLCYFLVSCSGGDNASFVLRQSNPRIEGSAAQGFTARRICNGRHGVISDVPLMHEAIGEDIAESSCFLMVTLWFRRVNSTIVWRYSRPYNKLPRGGARKRGEPKQGTMYRAPTRKDGRLKSRTGGPG